MSIKAEQTAIGNRNIQTQTISAIEDSTPTKAFLDALTALARGAEESPDVPQEVREKVTAETRHIKSELEEKTPQRDFVESAVYRIGQFLTGVSTLAPAVEKVGELLRRIWP